MQYFGLNSGGGIVNWYAVDSIFRISKGSNSCFTVMFDNGQSVMIDVENPLADTFINQLLTSTDKIIEINCTSHCMGS